MEQTEIIKIELVVNKALHDIANGNTYPALAKDEIMNAIKSLKVIGSIDEKFLLHLIDIVWMEAHEDESVPSTKWAKEMIAKAGYQSSQPIDEEVKELLLDFINWYYKENKGDKWNTTHEQDIYEYLQQKPIPCTQRIATK